VAQSLVHVLALSLQSVLAHQESPSASVQTGPQWALAVVAVAAGLPGHRVSQAVHAPRSPSPSASRAGHADG
jgi:hypothetical protein